MSQMTEKFEVPKYASIRGVEFRLYGKSYFRDKGKFLVWFRIIDGELFSWTEDETFDCCKIEEITKEEYIKSNQGFIDNRTYPHHVDNYVDKSKNPDLFIDINPYEKLIRDRRSDELSDVFWFSQSNLEDLPERLQDKFDEVISKMVDDYHEASVFSYDSIYHLWDVFVGKAIKDLEKCFYDTYEFKNEYRKETGSYAIQGFIDYINELRGNIVDGCGSSECDDYEYCAYSHEILNSFGTNDEMMLEEIKILAESSELSQRDFDFIDLVLANQEITFIKPLWALFDKMIKDDKSKC